MTQEEFLDRINEIMCGTSNAERACLEDLYDEVVVPHWISVEDELPPYNERVLVFYGIDRYIGFAMLEDVVGQQAFWNDSRKPVYHITHWMPMPQPPHHFADANKKVDRVIGSAEHIKTALDVLNKEGGEK